MQKEYLDCLSKLQELGLPKNESIVYMELLVSGESSANELAKNVNFDRTLCYQLLNKLTDKGLVHSYIKQKKKVFSLTDEKDLLLSIKQKEQIAEELLDTLAQLKQKTVHEQQNLLVYQGKQGVSAVLNELLKSKEVYIFGGVAKAFSKNNIPSCIVKKINDMHIKGKAIISDMKSYCNSGLNLKDMHIRELKGMNNLVTTIIYRSKVGIHILADTPIVIFIDSKSVSKSYIEHFNNLWKQAKDINR